jgi:hypothetical protein
VRVYSERIYGIPREQAAGAAGGVRYEYNAEVRPELIKEPKLLLNDRNSAWPKASTS